MPERHCRHAAREARYYADAKLPAARRCLIASCCHRDQRPGLIHAPLPPDCMNNLRRKFFGCRCDEVRCLAKVFELSEWITLCVEHASAGLA